MTNPTPTDWRALCAELVDALGSPDDFRKWWRETGSASPAPTPEMLLTANAWAGHEGSEQPNAQPEPTQDLSQLSDGYHTFAELYEHRHALCLGLMRAMPRHCWYSWRHADGERCFGGNDWFIIGIEPPGGNSVTYHLPAELYPAARATGAVELEKGRPWDGHSAADVALRLKEWAALAQPEPQGPTDEEIDDWHGRCADLTRVGEADHYWAFDLRHDEVADVVRAALARWGRRAIEPVPVDERLPGPEDCDAEGRCWVGINLSVCEHRSWILDSIADNDSGGWLPYWALPVPQQEGNHG